jgi:hypothetical protein
MAGSARIGSDEIAVSGDAGSGHVDAVSGDAGSGHVESVVQIKRPPRTGLFDYKIVCSQHLDDVFTASMNALVA